MTHGLYSDVRGIFLVVRNPFTSADRHFVMRYSTGFAADLRRLASMCQQMKTQIAGYIDINFSSVKVSREQTT